MLGHIRAVNDRPAAAFDVVDQDVKPAVFFDYALDKAWDFFDFQQIGLNDQVFLARIGKVPLQVRQLLFPVKIIQHHLNAPLCQRQTYAFADTFNGTEYEGNFLV